VLTSASGSGDGEQVLARDSEGEEQPERGAAPSKLAVFLSRLFICAKKTCEGQADSLSELAQAMRTDTGIQDHLRVAMHAKVH